MKKLLLSLFVAAGLLSAKADEGMWIPSLIGKNYEEMVRMGLKLTKEDLYSLNQPSIKDAVVQFGGGCTGEMISANGLLITNHHCGYGSIAGLSTVEHNYLDNGFWAYNLQDELPVKGLSVIFLQQIDDVTDEIAKATRRAKGDKYDKKLQEAIEKIEKRAEKDGEFEAHVKEYFNGNQYLLLVYRRYKDVRLVGTPPKSMGKYGGDTDNWMWPRHTADFSMFRVYAGKDNLPAEFSADNVPYKPKKFLPISLKNEKEGDFAMIFGYPGRTNRYEVSYGVDMNLQEVNPSIVNLREKRLAIMREEMDKDKATYLKLTSQYASISNYWKYFIGQTEQLKRLKVVDQKTKAEEEFTNWGRKNDDYKNLMKDYQAMYNRYRPHAKHRVYFYEGFRAPVLTKIATYIEPLEEALAAKKPNKDTVKKYADALQSAYNASMGLYVPAVDRKIFAEMTKMFYNDIPQSQHPDVYRNVIFKKFGNGTSDKTFMDYADYVYNNTFLLDSAKVAEFVKNPTLEQIQNDPAAVYALSFVNNYEDNYEEKYTEYSKAKEELSKTYVRGLMEMNKDRMFYPDANSTMRITYGKVLSYEPQDAVHYDYYTTLDGFMEKYKPGDYEFDAPQELVDLYKKKDYGRYADDNGVLRTCFITTNDITGGNSGSPVINGNGEWMGIAFDGNWEAMSGDIAFDKKYKRTICTDANFILFIIEKMGKAHNLIEEMDVRK